MSEKQPPIENEDNSYDSGRFIIFWMFILAVVAWIVSRFYSKEEQKKYKSQLAKEYDVSTKVLMHWLKTLAGDSFKEKYLETKKQLLPAETVAFYIGEPQDRLFNKKDLPIKTKTDLANVLFISNSTLTERIKNIEPYEIGFRMNYEQYAKLRTLPPLQVKLILQQMKTKGFDVSRVKSDVCPNSRKSS